MCSGPTLVQFLLQGSGPQLYGATLLQHFEVMLLLHVSDIVSQYARELGFVLELRIKTMSDEYIAARSGKRIDVVRLNHPEWSVVWGANRCQMGVSQPVDAKYSTIGSACMDREM